MPPPNEWARTEAISKAQAVVSGDLGVLEGSIALAALAHNLVPDWRLDPDFSVFGAVSSEIDDLPFGSVREGWSKDVLDRADSKASEYAALTGQQVLLACRNVIARFEARGSHPAQVLSNPSLERP
jgi:Protein of unknown function (DUF2489)